MAKKKFSRLSVMLEARDRMSGPMQKAARSSQALSGSVKNLSQTLNKSKSSVVNASVQQRVLAERYRQLGWSVKQTDEKLKMSTKLFRSLPAPIRMAAYTIEGYTKALVHMITQNTLAKITTKVLTVTFKGLYNAAWNIGNAVGMAAKALWDFSRAGKVIKFIAQPFHLAAQGAKLLAQNMMIGIKMTKFYKVMAAGVKEVAMNLKIATLQKLNFIKQIPNVVKGSKAWKLMERQVQKTAIAFTLLKNSSKTLENISNKATKIANAFNKITDPIRRNILGMKQFAAASDKAGGRGRATFNQLASANARLNKEISRMNRELSKANSRLGQMRTSMGSLNSMGAAFGTAYAAQAAYGTGERAVTSTVGVAMEQQYSSASVGILAGAENGAKFYEQIQNYAASTAYSAEDWARSMRGAISKSKTIEDLEKYQIALEQLATLDPVQGLDGAALAVRELNSGDIVSLVERFELPRSAVKSIKNIEDPIEQVMELSKLIGEETGYTVKNVQAMKELPLMQWKKMTNLIKTGMGYIGAGALEKLAPLFEKFNEMWDAGKFKPFIAAMSAGFADLVQKAIEFVTNFGSNIDSIKAKWQPVIDLINNIKGTFETAWPTISAIIENMRIILNLVAGEINAVWPAVNTTFQTVLELVKGISDWIVNNWGTIVPIISGVVAAMAGFKIASMVAAGITALKTVIAIWRNGTLLMTAAQWLLNTALLANPIVTIIALVIGIGVALYVAYQKSETFRNAVQAVWGWFKDVGMWIIDQAKWRIELLGDVVGAVADFFSNLWDKAKGAFDLIAGFSIPGALQKAADLVGKVAGFGGGGGGNGHHGGLSHVPYDGYSARLHKGERVLTAMENKEYSSGKGGGNASVSVTGNTFVVRNDSDIDEIANKLLKKLQNAQMG